MRKKKLKSKAAGAKGREKLIAITQEERSVAVTNAMWKRLNAKALAAK